MLVFKHASLPRRQAGDGWLVCLAGPALGQTQCAVWHLELPPQAALKLAAQAGEQALMLAIGSCRVDFACGPQRVTGPCTVRLPAGHAHELLNLGAEPLALQLVLAPPAPPLEE